MNAAELKEHVRKKKQEREKNIVEFVNVLYNDHVCGMATNEVLDLGISVLYIEGLIDRELNNCVSIYDFIRNHLIPKFQENGFYSSWEIGEQFVKVCVWDIDLE